VALMEAGALTVPSPAQLPPIPGADRLGPVLSGQLGVGQRLGSMRLVRLVCEIAGLWGINKLGYAIVTRLDIPLPGNVTGMLLLFALLSSGIVPPRLFEGSSSLLTRHLPFFFVPIAVGLMNLVSVFVADGWFLLLVLIASAAVGLCATGGLAQFLAHRMPRDRA
jgi:holin-like protein